MIHEKFVVRDTLNDEVCLFSKNEDEWPEKISLCAKTWNFWPVSLAGDGTPVCKRCAKFAKMRGWV